MSGRHREVPVADIDYVEARRWLQNYIPLWPRAVIGEWIVGLSDYDIEVLLDFALGQPYDIVRLSVLKKEWESL